MAAKCRRRPDEELIEFLLLTFDCSDEQLARSSPLQTVESQVVVVVVVVWIREERREKVNAIRSSTIVLSGAA